MAMGGGGAKAAGSSPKWHLSWKVSEPQWLPPDIQVMNRDIRGRYQLPFPATKLGAHQTPSG